MERIYSKDLIYGFLSEAHAYASQASDCTKVQVGSLLHTVDDKFFFGANIGIGYSCKENGCRRVALYGENSKDHRLPSDCNSLHSEVHAIGKAAASSTSTLGATLFITRYPCEACARAIVAAGIKQVYYGREQEISDYTKQILDAGHVEYHHVSEWTAEDCTN